MNKYYLICICIIILILCVLMRDYIVAKWYLYKLKKYSTVKMDNYKCCGNCKYYEDLINYCKYCGYIYLEDAHLCDRFSFSLEWLRSIANKRNMNNFRDRTKVEGDQ